jgi:hypothetical protein
MAALVSMCRSDLVTDRERVVQAWLCSEEFGTITEGINSLAGTLAGNELNILASAATKVLSNMLGDELGIGIGTGIKREFDPRSFVSRDFIVALSQIARA